MAQPTRPAARISIDYRFAAIPCAIITDSRLSASAVRLWGVLFMLDYLHEDPDVTTLAKHMQQGDKLASRASIYRWLGELEQAGWLDWQHTPGKAGVNDRFVLITRPAEPVSPVRQVDPPDMKPVSQVRQPVSQVRQVVSPVRQVDDFPPLSERAELPPKSHESYIEHDGDRVRTLLQKIGLYNGTIKQVLALGIDHATLISSVECLTAAGWGAGAIADQLREHPPEKGKPYVTPEQRPAPAHNQRRRARATGSTSHGPTGGAELRDPGWAARAVAEAEQRARVELLDL